MGFRLLWRGAVLLLIAAGLTACAGGQRPSLDELIERNAEAVGGKAVVEAIRSIRVDLHIVDPGFEVDGTYFAARPGKMRIDITANGKHVYTEAFNGVHGWQWTGEGEPVEESQQATASLRHGIELPGHLFGLHELRQRGHRIELVGREKIDHVNYYVLQITFSDGYQTKVYLDPVSWLLTRRRDFRPLHPDVDPAPTTIEAKTSDFRRVGGVLFGFASVDTDLNTGKVLERTTIRSIELNPGIDPQLFDRL